MVKMRHFVCLDDFNTNQLKEFIALGSRLKKAKNVPKVLRGKNLCLIFEKPSLRTKVSFQVAIERLGGKSFYLGPGEAGLGKREAPQDIARTLSQYVEGVVVRTFSFPQLLRFCRYSKIPVINALTDYNHPCQVLADLLTVKEVLGKLKGVKIAYIGDGNNVCNSWIFAASKLGFRLSISSPRGYFPEEGSLKKAASKSITLHSRPEEAVAGADIIYTDVWASMGKENEASRRRRIFRPFQVNRNLLKYVNKRRFFVMHCLPAHRGEEITEEVIESSRSIVFQQAQNRLYIQMAILYKIYKR